MSPNRSKTCSDACYKIHDSRRKKEYREKDASRWSKYNKDYRAKNLERCKKSSSASRIRFMETVPSRPDKRVIMLVRAARGSALRRGLEFNLSSDVVMLLIDAQHRKCAVTGIDFDWEFGGAYRANPFAPSIDRRNSQKGYTYDNIQIVCYAVNLAKNEYPIDVFDTICKARVQRLNDG